MDPSSPPAAAAATTATATASANEETRASRLSLDSEKKIEVVYESLGYTITKPVPRSAREALSGTPKKTETKNILNEITGMFKPGRLTAIMGNSGAGKTSLLNVLAGNVKSSPMVKVTGKLQVNGKEVQPNFMKKISGFVFQDDLILATMTVREAITMSALLRLPETVDRKAKLELVDDIIKALRLEKAADTIVGNERIKGISGGERKRTSMAMEMVINPSILFLDEPTSGLDTFTAFSVVTTLKDLAEQGRTVVATIHQPSSDIFMIFDDLVLLSEGRVVYYGEASNAVSYFGKRGYECPQYMNPSDYIFMHILNNSDEIEARHKKSANEEAKETGMDRIKGLIKAWPESEDCKALNEAVKHPFVGGIPDNALKVNASWGDQFSFLFVRAFKNAIRNKLLVFARIFQAIFLGVLMGIIYFDIPSRDFQSQIQDRDGLLFFLCLNNLMGSSIAVLSVFTTEKSVFTREVGAGYYYISPYFLSKVLVEIPLFTLAPIFLVSVNYFMVGFDRIATKFFTQMGITILVGNTGVALGMFLSSFFQNLSVSLAVMPAILLPVMMFSGFLINLNSIPVYFSWIQWLSPIKYALCALVKNEYLDVSGNTNPGSGILLSSCPFPVNSPNYKNCFGQAEVDRLSLINQLDVGQNCLVLLGYFLILMVLAFLSLIRITPKP